MQERPNIVLICVDQWRGDCLSIHGHPVVHTPYLDQLAWEGARFRRAYSATPSCIPARTALFTGQRQKTHGRVGYQDGIPWNYTVTLAGEFARHGYQTHAIGKMHVYPERAPMGFQKVILHDGYLHHTRRHHANDLEAVDDYLLWLRKQTRPDADYCDHGVECNSYLSRPWDKAEYLHPTNFVVTQALDFLGRVDRSNPFFLFLSFRAPHPPYDPPAWALDQYLNEPMPSVPVGDWVDEWRRRFPEYDTPLLPACDFGKIPGRHLQRARAGYYGLMTHLDHQLNRFLETLLMRGLRDNTVICFVSDHGEMLGDHHFFRKTLPYEGSARIPMIITGPRQLGIQTNSIHDAVVELRDVMPTLLDCAGLSIPDAVEGRSLLPLARGDRPPWREYLHGEHTAFKQSIQWLTDGREKYIWYSGTGWEQFFNLNNDPRECHDCAGDPSFQTRLEYWRTVLIKELAGREEGFTDGNKLITGRPVQSCLAHIRGQ